MFNGIYAIATLIGLCGFVEGSGVMEYCKDLMSHSPEIRLKIHLFCTYDSEVRPEKHGQKNVTKVSLLVLPKKIEVDDSTNVFTVHTWTKLNWTDLHLTWKPSDYDGIDTLHVPGTDLWIPDVTVHNAGELGSDVMQGVSKTICGLESDGQISCIPSVKYSSYCDTDYTDYPFDIQKCIVEFSSWAYSTDQIDLDMNNSSIVLSDYTSNMEWKFVGTVVKVEKQNFKMNPNFTSQIHKLTFILQRRGAGMHTVYIAPAIVLMVMTLTALWLDCRATEQMIVACLSFICHLICIMDLFFSIPHNGSVTPKIVRFYESSFLLMTFTLILTVLLRELRSFTSPAPPWISSGTAYILESRVGQVLLLSILDPKASAFLEKSADDNDDLVQREQKDSTWNYVVLLIGWLAFIAVFFAYMILLALYIPTHKSLKRAGLIFPFDL